MAVLLFVEEHEKDVRIRLLSIVASIIPSIDFVILRTLKSLYENLRFPSRENRIAILSAFDQGRLKDFVSLAPFFEGISLILILPDHRKKTISIAHSLKPRFIAYQDGDFDIIGQVLAKMVGTRTQERLRHSNADHSSTVSEDIARNTTEVNREAEGWQAAAPR